MFLIVLLKRETFSSTEKFTNGLFQEKSVIAFFIALDPHFGNARLPFHLVEDSKPSV